MQVQQGAVAFSTALRFEAKRLRAESVRIEYKHTHTHHKSKQVLVTPVSGKTASKWQGILRENNLK